MRRVRVGGGRPWIVAHRGAMKRAPENTRAAFDLALRAGVDGIEFDVQLSRDGVPVIFHDRSLAKAGRRGRRVSDLTMSELRSLDYGGWFDPSFRGEPILTLSSMLRSYAARTRLFIEIKSRKRDLLHGRNTLLASKVVEAVRQVVPARSRSNLFVLSFDPGVLEAAAGKEPRWRYILNVESPRDYAKKNLPMNIPLFGCCLPVKRLTPAFARSRHREGLRVLTYSCNVPRQFRAALRAGADVILTDDPRLRLLEKFNI